MKKGNRLTIDKEDGDLNIIHYFDNAIAGYVVAFAVLFGLGLIGLSMNLHLLGACFTHGLVGSCLNFLLFIFIVILLAVPLFLAELDRVKNTNIKIINDELFIWNETSFLKRKSLFGLELYKLKHIYIFENNELRGVRIDGFEFIIMKFADRQTLWEVKKTLIVHLKNKGIELEEIGDSEEELESINLPPVFRFERDNYSSKEAENTINKQKNRLTHAALSPIFFAKVIDRIPFQNQEYQIVHIVQTDWKNGSTDKQYQTIGLDNLMHLFYLEQNKATINAYKEEALKLHQLEHRQFSVTDAPNQLTLGQQTYFLVKHNIGSSFINEEEVGYKEEQWTYRTEDDQKQIRVVKNEGLFSYYKGEKLEVADFYGQSQETLDLDENPIKRKADQEKQKIIRRNRAEE